MKAGCFVDSIVSFAMFPFDLVGSIIVYARVHAACRIARMHTHLLTAKQTLRSSVSVEHIFMQYAGLGATTIAIYQNCFYAVPV